MNEKERMRRRVNALAFAVHELVLFLDTHPENRQAMTLLEEYRRRHAEAVADYESKYGRLIVTVSDAMPSDSWQWLDDPWPWEQEA